MNYRKILADNVRALKARSLELHSNAKIAKRCRAGNRKIGASTIAHLLNEQGGVYPKLDTIIAVAEAFKIVPPWLLLTPDFDPDKKTGGDLPDSEVFELALKIHTMTAPEKALLMKIFTKGTPNGDPEDMRAAVTLHEPTKHKDYERSIKRQR